MGYLFYKSIIACILFTPISYFLLQQVRLQKAEKRRWELREQFKDGIQSISNALNAGYSIENAFTEAIADLTLLYSEKTDIIVEFVFIQKQIALNQNVEMLLLDFGRRSGIDDIESFAEVLATAKRTGGDLIKIIRMTSASISDKVEIEREIRTLLSAKKLEAKIMSVIPLAIILYLWMGMPEFLLPLYNSIVGRITMTIVLAIYMTAAWLLKRIVDIKV